MKTALTYFFTAGIAHGKNGAESSVVENSVAEISTQGASILDLHFIIISLGITTFVFLLITATIGLTKKNFKFHKPFALLTLVFALSHAALVFFSSFTF